MDNFFLSIIIPIYNTLFEDFKNCIDSINFNTVPYEIIAVDDGSKKDIEKCVEYTKDNPNVKWLRKENEGVSVARNCGITIAKGKYVFFLDSDDLLPNEFIDLIDSEWKNIDADWILFDLQLYSIKNSKISYRQIIPDEYYSRSSDGRKASYKLGISDAIGILSGKSNLNESCGKLIKREILLNNSVKFPEGMISGEDYYFNTKLLLYVSDITYYPCSGYIYRTGIIKKRAIYNIGKHFNDLERKNLSIENLVKTKQSPDKVSNNIKSKNIIYMTGLVQSIMDISASGSLDNSTKEIIEKWLQDNPILTSITYKDFRNLKKNFFII